LIDRRKFIGMVSTAGLLTACGPRPIAEKWPFHVGERISCGWFSYNVLEVAYKSQLGDGTLAKQAVHGFLTLRLQATSSAGATVSIPFLRLETDSGDFIPEVEDGSALPGWMGILRRVEPGSTESGWLIFDVLPGVYGLRLSDGVLEDEKTAMVRIPFHMDTRLKT